MKLSELIYRDEYRTRSVFEDPEIKHVARSIDAIRPFTLFVCIRGGRVDTHTLIREAVSAGAIAIVVEIGSGFQRIPGIPILEVPSSRSAYARAFSRFVGSPEKHLQIIGITGTNGKTSTAHMLTSILRHNGYKTGLIGTVRCETEGGYVGKPAAAATMTTPEPEVLYPLFAEMVKNQVTHAVMEVSSHALSQGRVAPIEFSVAVFTNLSAEHLDYHRTLEEYLRAKAKLFGQCRRAAVLIGSKEAESICKATKGELYRCTLGDRNGADASASILSTHEMTGSEIRIHLGDESVDTLLPIPGAFSVENALCAALAAHLLGVSTEKIGQAISSLKPIPGRMERLPDTGLGFEIIIDYAHTERALRRLLETVRGAMKDKGRLILLFGCGGERDRTKRAAMGRCAEELADFTIVTSDNSRREDPKQIIREILIGMPKREKRRVIVDRRRAIGYAVTVAREGDVVLLVGKGHETYEAVGLSLRPFDERKIVQKALDRRKNAHTIPVDAEGKST